MRLLQRPKQVLYTKKVKTSIYEFNTLLLGIRRRGGGCRRSQHPIIAMALERVRKGIHSLLLTAPSCPQIDISQLK